MIPNYLDHSANERTFLTWVRVSITIMIFGFIIERFDIFIAYIKANLEKPAHDAVQMHTHLVAEVIGFGLFALGILLLIIATVQYHHTQINIDKEEILPYRLRYYTWLMSGVLVVCGIILMGYLAYNLSIF